MYIELCNKEVCVFDPELDMSFVLLSLQFRITDLKDLKKTPCLIHTLILNRLMDSPLNEVKCKGIASYSKNELNLKFLIDGTVIEKVFEVIPRKFMGIIKLKKI